MHTHTILYHIVGFSRYLNSANGRFLVFYDFIFTNESAKKDNYLEQLFFKGLNFTNGQHPWNSWNLHTLKETNYTVLQCHSMLLDGSLIHTVQFTTIPLPSKLFKLLVKDLENALEATQAGNHDNNDDGDSNASSGVS